MPASGVRHLGIHICTGPGPNGRALALGVWLKRERTALLAAFEPERGWVAAREAEHFIRVVASLLALSGIRLVVVPLPFIPATATLAPFALAFTLTHHCHCVSLDRASTKKSQKNRFESR